VAQRVVADVTGDRELIRDLLRLGDKGLDMAKDILGEATRTIANRAKSLSPVDPIDGGQLRDSIRATKPTRTRAGRISAGVLAGGASLARLVSERGHKEPGSYALIVHEDPTLKHSQGQFKFIEQPFLEVAPKVPDMVLDALDKVTRG